jgi:predicted transcriptional regulator
MIETFKQLGFTNAQSKVLNVLIDEQWHLASDIRDATGLQQPEVSIALKGLEKHLEVGRIEKGRGAPFKPVRIVSKGAFIESLRLDILSDFNTMCELLVDLGDFTSLHEEQKDRT